jgi:hypothetical protein
MTYFWNVVGSKVMELHICLKRNNYRFHRPHNIKFGASPLWAGRYWKFILIIIQRDATQNSLFTILHFHSTCFGCQPHPSSGVHKTVTAASSIVQLPPSDMATLAWPLWREVAAQEMWPVPEAVVTVLCTPDDGCGSHPKHAEWNCRIINRLLCVASRLTIINTDQRCTEP